MLTLISRNISFIDIYTMESEINFTIKDRELKRDRFKKRLFISAMITVFAILILNLLSFLILK